MPTHRAACLACMTCLVVASSPAWGQSGTSAAEQDPWSDVEEFIVTGTAGAATLAQSTSTAVTAFDAFELDRRGIDDIDSLGLNVPNLFISKNGASPVVTIRGIGSTSGGISADEAVAVHVDGVYIKRPLFLSAEFFDLADLEVSRGPQGFRGGKNANGGALNFVSRKPEDELSASVTTTVGNYESKRVTGYLNTPILDALATRFAYFYEKRESYATLTGRFAGQFKEEAGDDADSLGFRQHVRYSPTEQFEILLSGNYFQQKGAGPAVSLTGELSQAAILDGVTPLSSDPRRVSLNFPPDQNNKIFGGSVTLLWEMPTPDWVDALDLTVIGAWERVQRSDERDGDLTDVDYQRQTLTDAQEQGSAEAYVDLEAGRLVGRAGLWFFDERFDTDLELECRVCGPPPDDRFIDIRTQLDGRSWGVFGDAEWSFDEFWTMQLGARYSWDARNGFGERVSRFGGFSGQPFGFGASEEEWEGLTARLNLEWAPTEDSLFYVQLSRGYRSGGLNLGLDADPAGNRISNIVLPPYAEETVWTYEVGTKNEFLNGDLRFNATVFFMDYTDLQVAQPVFGVVRTDSVSEVQNIGIEIEGHYSPVPPARIDYTLSWQRARVQRGIANDPIQTLPGVVQRDLLQDIGGNRLPNAPELTIRLGAEYAFELGSFGILTPRIQYFWQDETYYRVFNTDLDVDESRQILDAKVTWQSREGRLRLVAFVNNVLDEDMVRRLTPVIGFGVPGNQPPQLQRQTTAPRIYGLSMSVTY